MIEVVVRIREKDLSQNFFPSAIKRSFEFTVKQGIEAFRTF